MRRLRMLVLGLTALLAAALPAVAQNAVPRIGVASPGRIFAGLDETKAIQQRLAADQNALKSQLESRRADLEKLKAARDVLQPTSADFQAKNRELLQKVIEFETEAKIAQADFARAQKMMMFNLFRKIEDGVHKVAQQKGLDLVLAEQGQDLNPEQLEGINIEQLRALLNQRNVLYNSETIDITQEVIGKLNLEYQAAGAQPAPAAAPVQALPALPAVPARP